MSADDASLLLAEQRTRVAQSELKDTVAEIKARLQPAVLADQALALLRTQRDSVKRDALEIVEARPGELASAAGVIALFLFRRPLIRAVRKLFSKRDETVDATKG